MNLCLVLQQPGPKLLTDFLLPQNQFNVAVGVVDFAFLWINGLVELKVTGIGDVLGCGFSGEDDFGGLQVEFQGGGWDVGGADGEVDDVAGCIGFG
jgi:hypothetical protein